MFSFPFEKIEKGARIVIYGAGEAGRDYITQIDKTGYCNIVCIVDRQHEIIQRINNYDVISPNAIKNLRDFDYVLISVSLENAIIEIREFLLSNGIPEMKIVPNGMRKANRNYGNITYSQYGEDWLIYFLFRTLGVYQPSYIDIGAHHPFINNNTAVLYEHGCRGVNIEANPSLMENFYVHRPDDININIGVGVQEGVMPFYMFNDRPGRSTFSQEDAESTALTYRNLTYQVWDIPVTTLEKVIDKHFNGKWPQYMTVDIEGLDFEVISDCNLIEGPLFITVEVRINEKEFNEMMRSKGYIPYLKTFANITYAKKKIMEEMFH